MIIVGGMANNIIEYQGNNVGKSIKIVHSIINEIMNLSKKKIV